MRWSCSQRCGGLWKPSVKGSWFSSSSAVLGEFGASGLPGLREMVRCCEVIACFYCLLMLSRLASLRE